MANVTTEQLLEAAEDLQARFVTLNDAMGDVKRQTTAIRLHMQAMQQDTRTIAAILVRQDNRLDRIERRLEPTESPLVP